ncbi:hypothetical protein, partial [Xanthomonas perforans]|uniref:hypothetical protein n=1 Tax=Xanthomonas perforans TaxID=442694 RepID=UPI001F3C647B
LPVNRQARSMRPPTTRGIPGNTFLPPPRAPRQYRDGGPQTAGACGSHREDEPEGAATGPKPPQARM